MHDYFCALEDLLNHLFPPVIKDILIFSLSRNVHCCSLGIWPLVEENMHNHSDIAGHHLLNAFVCVCVCVCVCIRLYM